MLYPVLFAIRHSILTHLSPSVSCCTSLCEDGDVQNGKDLKRVTQITLVFEDHLYKPHCKTHTRSKERWAQSVTQGNSLHFINFRTFFRCKGKTPTHRCSHTTFHSLLCFPHILLLQPPQEPPFRGIGII